MNQTAFINPLKPKILLISGGNDSLFLYNKYEFDKLIYLDYGQPYKKDELKRIPKKTKIIKINNLKIDKKGYVKGRNLLFLIEIAKRYTDGTIYMGTNKDDIFPDNNQKYLKKAIEVINTSFETNLNIKTPLKAKTKKEIMKYIRKNNIDTYSCYKGGKPCGICKACLESKK